MELKEKQIIVSVTSSVVVLLGYWLYVYNNYLAVNSELINDFKFWGTTFMIFIPVAIVAQIVIHIIFAIINKAITNEDIDTTDDERDKMIELKTIRISHWIFVVGFLLAMATQAFGMQPWVMFATLIGAGFISSTISESLKIYYYRRGL